MFKGKSSMRLNFGTNDGQQPNISKTSELCNNDKYNDQPQKDAKNPLFSKNQPQKRIFHQNRKNQIRICK